MGGCEQGRRHVRVYVEVWAKHATASGARQWRQRRGRSRRGGQESAYYRMCAVVEVGLLCVCLLKTAARLQSGDPSPGCSHAATTPTEPSSGRAVGRSIMGHACCQSELNSGSFPKNISNYRTAA